MRIGVVIVAYRSGAALAALLDALAGQRGPGDVVVVVDNGPGGEDARAADAHPAVDAVVRPGGNVGFAAGANAGAARARDVDAVLFLNPDCLPEPGFLDALRSPPEDWDAWMGLVTLADGRRVNTRGGVVHYLGVAWAGGHGGDAASVGAEPRPVGFLSGACLAIRRPALDAVGGFHEPLFMYGEDVDLSHRLRLAGRRFGLLPAARARHDYEFAKGGEKWRLLERNRWLVVLRTYPRPLLLAVLPALLAAEPVLWAAAARGGWARPRARAVGGALRALPRTLRERRGIQATARVGAAEFARGLSATLDSPFLGAPARLPAARAASELYWGLVLRALRRGAGRATACH